MTAEISRQMYLTYLTRREQDLHELQKSLAQQRAKSFEKIGHQVMGNAAMFGFYDLERLARKVHDVNTQNLRSEGPKLIEEWTRWINETRAKLSRRYGFGQSHALV